MNDSWLETMRKQIFHADSYAWLCRLREQVHEMVLNHLQAADPLECNHQMNQLHDWLIRRTVMLAEGALLDRGMGLPPVSYAFVLFGSGGRQEQTLWSDQDNGLIYQDPPAGIALEAESYFRCLGDEIVEGLMLLGYPPCEGNVLCRNPMWCTALSNWKETVRRWVAEPSWENARYALIFADIRCIYGDESLARQLKQAFFADLADNRAALGDLLNNTLHRKVSMGIFGQLIPERYGEDAGGFDVKYGSYIPLVNGIRFLALESGCMATSTGERIESLVRDQADLAGMAAEWKRALSINLMLRSLASHNQDGDLYHSSGKIPLRLMTKTMRQELKDSLRVCRRLHRYTRKIVERKLARREGRHPG